MLMTSHERGKDRIVIKFPSFLLLFGLVAFVSSLAFESPMMGLEKALLKRSERNR